MALEQAVQAAWEVGLAATASAATVLAALGTEQVGPSSRPSLLSPFKEEASALGRLKVQETRTRSLQRRRPPLRHTLCSPQLLMDEAHHLTWPLLFRPRQCSDCTRPCRPFSESERQHPLPTDSSLSPAPPASTRGHFDLLSYPVNSYL
jgi:hypothetical protein